MTRGVTEAAQALALQLSAVIHKLDGQAYSSTLSALNSLTAALAAEPGAAEGWQPIRTAPWACHVLATRFDNEYGEWVVAVVLSPPSAPFTHWMHLPAAPHQSGESGK